MRVYRLCILGTGCWSTAPNQCPERAPMWVGTTDGEIFKPNMSTQEKNPTPAETKSRKERSNKKLRTSSPTHEPNQQNDNFSRFLMAHATNPDLPLSKLSPFALDKAIQSLAVEPKDVKRLRSGDLLIEVTRKSHADNLLRATTLLHIPVTITPHRTLNNSRCVIRCRDLQMCSDR